MNNYVTFAEGGFGITAGKLYHVHEGRFFDDVGDERVVEDVSCDVATEGAVRYVIRCIESPNLSCKDKFINKEPDYTTGHIACTANHPAGAYHFTLDEVAEFLRFTYKQYDEHKRSSKFEVLLAPIRVVAEPPQPKVGNGGHAVGTILRCVVSGHRELVVGQFYEVNSIDSDGDELLMPLDPNEHTYRQNRRFPSLASNPEFARATVFTVVN